MSGRGESSTGERRGTVPPTTTTMWGGTIRLRSQVIYATGTEEGKVGDRLAYSVESFDRRRELVWPITRNNVRWKVRLGEEEEALDVRGESIEIEARFDWMGKEITVIPYISQVVESAEVVTRITGVLDQMNYQLQLEEVVAEKREPLTINHNTNQSTEELEEAAKEIHGALHRMKIYTPFGNVDRGKITTGTIDGISAFQREYIMPKINDGLTRRPNTRGFLGLRNFPGTTGKIDGATLFFMNEALSDGWVRTRHFRDASGNRYIVNDPVLLRQNRVPQNDMNPEDPDGPCFMRALQAAAEEFVNRNLTLDEIRDSAKDLVPAAMSAYYEILNHTEVVNDALRRLGFQNIITAEVTSYLIRDGFRSRLTDDEELSLTKVMNHVNTNFTVRMVNNGGHFQLGNNRGNFLWDPFRFRLPASINRGDPEDIRLINFTVRN